MLPVVKVWFYSKQQQEEKHNVSQVGTDEATMPDELESYLITQHSDFHYETLEIILPSEGSLDAVVLGLLDLNGIS